MKPALGRVLDPDALDACGGPRARLRVAIPTAWAEAGATISFGAPARLACARCDGGGCDGCGRSGVLRAPEDASLRTLTVTVPPGRSGPFVLRMSAPFGAGASVEQLLVEIVPGDEPSAGVTRLERASPARRALEPRSVALALVVALLTAITAFYATRGGH